MKQLHKPRIKNKMKEFFFKLKQPETKDKTERQKYRRRISQSLHDRHQFQTHTDTYSIATIQ